MLLLSTAARMTVPPMADGETLGDRLRAARERAGLAQDDLARELEKLGVKTTNAAISRIERGATHDPGSQLLIAIAKRLGVSAVWLVTGEDTEPDAPPPDPPYWGEFLRRYEHVTELSPKQLEDVKRFAARSLRVRSWTDFERVAEIVRTSRPSPTFEAKKTARQREKAEKREKRQS